jgi:hypothetical protein
MHAASHEETAGRARAVPLSARLSGHLSWESEAETHGRTLEAGFGPNLFFKTVSTPWFRSGTTVMAFEKVSEEALALRKKVYSMHLVASRS